MKAKKCCLRVTVWMTIPFEFNLMVTHKRVTAKPWILEYGLDMTAGTGLYAPLGWVWSEILVSVQSMCNGTGMQCHTVTAKI